MQLLIDGYNLLHVTGVFADAVGQRSVEKLHAALLDFLASCLGPEQSARTTVVFDARGRRAVHRRVVQHAGITVHYAARTEDADTLIAELIQKQHAPRQLVVVSSDHQVQRAARRRRAKAVDSAVWHGELMRRRREQQSGTPRARDIKPPAPLSEHDVQWWLKQFEPDLLREVEADLQSVSRVPPGKAKAPPEPSPGSEEPPENRTSEPLPEREVGQSADLDSPFPPEYLAEIQRELERNSARDR